MGDRTPPQRFVVTGAESTGKTTVAAALAERFGGVLVPEYLRTYVEQTGRLPSARDLEEVARGHCANEDAILAGPHARPVFYDTDLYTIVIYARHYFGSCPTWIEAEAAARQADLYLLMSDDIPWMPDPQREDARTRTALHAGFVRLFAPLIAAGRCVLIYGDGADRWSRAKAAVETALHAHRSSQDPDGAGIGQP